ncbi:ABC transporter G family member 20-like isoform X2 [Bacillus rossius redtenbacheri]|uniref:ABC transporter G family member 20-like isoform X2 n=1 Tax=Bacillus rossius redtenbacheri TaxID=93214 RepID=UPI002FDDB789
MDIRDRSQRGCEQNRVSAGAAGTSGCGCHDQELERRPEEARVLRGGAAARRGPAGAGRAHRGHGPGAARSHLEAPAAPQRRPWQDHPLHHALHRGGAPGAQGLMRNGRLLEEGSPASLVSKHGLSGLEDVFLLLSLRQESGEPLPNTSTEHQKIENSNLELAVEETNHQGSGRSDVLMSKGLVSSGNMRALIFKNLVVASRDITHVLFAFGLLVVAVSSVYLGLGPTPRDLRLAVVNHDRGSARHDCRGPALGDAGCSYRDLSCRFLAQLHGPIILKEFYNSTEEAVEATRKGRAWGVLHFHSNFTEALVERALNSTRPSDGALEDSNIYVRLDMSNYATGLLLRQEILAAFDRFAELMLVSCGYSTKLAHNPVRINDPVYGSYPLNFLNFAAPGTLIVMMFFFGVALTVWAITAERRQGLVNRNFVAGVRSYEVLLSYLMSEFVIMTSQAVLLVSLSLFVYKFQCIGSTALAIVIIYLQGINGILLGLIISCSCDREETTNYLAIGSLVPLLLFCGIIWPVEGMDTPVRIVSVLSPLTMPVKGLRAVMARGWTILDFEVYAGLFMTFAWTVVFGLACLVIFRFKKL